MPFSILLSLVCDLLSVRAFYYLLIRMINTLFDDQIGFLISLKQNLEEITSVPQLPILQGLNVVGRNTISVLDKRLSRKHLTLIASADGSANVVVEGTNPVVICSGNQRKKLCSRESAKIISGDVIELIPGHHLFKYVALAGEDNVALDDGDYGSSSKEVKSSESEKTCQKRTHQASESEEIARKLPSKMGKKKEGDCEETIAIGNFNVAEDRVPLTFRLLRVKGLPAWANSHCLSITDVIQGNVLIAIISNYMVDIDWLLSACPALAKVPHVLVIHGEGDGSLDHMKRNKPANWILHKPPLPISYGTHHSKALLLVYPRGLRVVVHTANLIHVDWNNKTQGLWMQDFPWKHQNEPNRGGGFETDLIDYLSVLKWPEFTASLPSIGSFNINPSFFKKFDYSSAAVRLVASVPGYHTSPYLKKWGHMKLRTVLQECIFDKEFKKSPLIYQFSSLGSLDEKWMAELASSMSSGVSSDKKPLGLGEPQIIWPTVEDVRCSLEGYAAGNAIPSPQKNVEKEFLKKYWSKWKASHTGRCRAMPHIKTYTRYAGQNLAWFLLSSANLSKAAWGALQKNNSQLMIRSYELGVLFLPSSMSKICCKFSCTDNANPEIKYEPAGTSQVQETKLVTSTWQGMGSEVIRLPVPYELPPKPYDPEDIPWSWDRKYHKKDVYGQVWPRQVKLYLSQDS